tara:strand:+ start:2680 stop:2958 length:279 start_codon:yes stop_codon:yes gene_type:complete
VRLINKGEKMGLKKYIELYNKYVRTGEIFKKRFILLKYELGKGTVEKTVSVTAVLDGPERDPRDYCFVTGLHPYEVDMPLEEFFNNIIREKR